MSIYKIALQNLSNISKIAFIPIGNINKIANVIGGITFNPYIEEVFYIDPSFLTVSNPGNSSPLNGGVGLINGFGNNLYITGTTAYQYKIVEFNLTTKSVTRSWLATPNGNYWSCDNIRVDNNYVYLAQPADSVSLIDLNSNSIYKMGVFNTPTGFENVNGYGVIFASHTYKYTLSDRKLVTNLANDVYTGHSCANGSYAYAGLGGNYYGFFKVYCDSSSFNLVPRTNIFSELASYPIYYNGYIWYFGTTKCFKVDSNGNLIGYYSLPSSNANAQFLPYLGNGCFYLSNWGYYYDWADPNKGEYLYKFDPNTGQIVSTYSFAQQHRGIWFDGNKYLYVSGKYNNQDNAILKIRVLP